MKRYPSLLALLFLLSCSAGNPPSQVTTGPYIVVLGIAQDAGYPQSGCQKTCCRVFWEETQKGEKVTSLGIVLPGEKKLFLADATPDFKEQWHVLQEIGGIYKEQPDGIFLTHAHIGHYTGLMQLGKEAMNADRVPVYCFPRMKSFLESNGPWEQLVTNGNIITGELQPDAPVSLGSSVTVIPFPVPHRDEYSETAGFIIQSGTKRVLFIPDIDKWQKWNRDIVKEIPKVDAAFIDGSFYRNGELERDMSLIPHPFITESMQVLDALPPKEKSKIYFIHFNHTNPVFRNTPQQKELLGKGFRVAEEGLKILL